MELFEVAGEFSGLQVELSSKMARERTANFCCGDLECCERVDMRCFFLLSRACRADLLSPCCARGYALAMQGRVPNFAQVIA